jgi:hypothetical protein
MLSEKVAGAVTHNKYLKNVPHNGIIFLQIYCDMMAENHIVEQGEAAVSKQQCGKQFHHNE